MLMLHYNKLYGIIMLTCGVIVGILSLLTRDYLNLFWVLIMFVLGVSVLSRTYVTVEPNNITVYALLGPQKRPFPYTSPGQIKIENGSLFVDGKRLPVARWLVDASDWTLLENKFK